MWNEMEMDKMEDRNSDIRQNSISILNKKSNNKSYPVKNRTST